MNREEKNAGSLILFVIVILVIIIGGFFLINGNKKEEVVNDTKNDVKKGIKLDNSKNYIYYTNESVLSDKEDITYKDINININSKDAKEIQDKFNNQMVEIKKNVTYENDKLKEAEVIDYSFTTTSKYLSLTVSNYIIDDKEDIKDSAMLYYVFDLEDGKLLSNQDILKKESISDQQVRKTIRDFFQNDESVDIDATLNQDYSLTFASDGKIQINVLVKTIDKEYYTNIEM